MPFRTPVRRACQVRAYKIYASLAADAADCRPASIYGRHTYTSTGKACLCHRDVFRRAPAREPIRAVARLQSFAHAFAFVPLAIEGQAASPCPGAFHDLAHLRRTFLRKRDG